MKTTEFQYWYQARVIRVVDGDTVDFAVDLGLHTVKGTDRRGERFRLFGINAPEMEKETRDAGIAAKIYLEHMLIKFRDEKMQFLIRTYKDRKGKYGRYLAEIWGVEPGLPVSSVRSSGGRRVNLNARMIAAGHAVEEYYGAKERLGKEED